MDLLQYPGVQDILCLFRGTPDRYASHLHAAPLVKRLCADREFLHAAIRSSFADRRYFRKNRHLVIPVVSYGDIFLSINLFVPIRGSGEGFAQDLIHHHGWRLLTSAVITGQGYDAIVFKKHSHKIRSDDTVYLEIDEILQHELGRERFIDADTCHVVFHPTSLTTTLALWSADRVLLNQNVKRALRRFPMIQRAAAKTARALRWDRLLGLNTFRGRYFRPENGRIAESTTYHHDADGTHEEVFTCIFGFLQQVEFDEIDMLRRLGRNAPPYFARLVDMLAQGESIPDLGVSSDARRRFTREDVLDAVKLQMGQRS